MSKQYATQKPAGKTGDKINYFGTEATITNVVFCIYAEQFFYKVKYYEGGTRHGASFYQNEIY